MNEININSDNKEYKIKIKYFQEKFPDNCGLVLNRRTGNTEEYVGKNTTTLRLKGGGSLPHNFCAIPTREQREQLCGGTQAELPWSLNGKDVAIIVQKVLGGDCYCAKIVGEDTFIAALSPMEAVVELLNKTQLINIVIHT